MLESPCFRPASRNEDRLCASALGLSSMNYNILWRTFRAVARCREFSLKYSCYFPVADASANGPIVKPTHKRSGLPLTDRGPLARCPDLAHDTGQVSRFSAEFASRAAALVLAACVVACAPKVHPQARVEPPPALTVPVPPPRLVVPPQPESAPPPEDETEPPATSRPRPPRLPSRPEGTRPEPARQEPAPDQSKSAQPEATPAAAPSPDLQPADATGAAAIRQQMSSASQALAKVNYATLSPDMRAQYDTASRFLALADQALKERNLLFASTLADKAGAIASLLTGR